MLHTMSIGSWQVDLPLSLSHVSALSQFPSLRHLRLCTVLIESLEPLSSGPLESLMLLSCYSRSSGYVCLRSLVPALPRLTDLTFWETNPMTRVEAAALNELLFERCPALSAKRFVLQFSDGLTM